MNRILLWIIAVRPQFFTATMIPIVLGAAVARYYTGYFDWGLFWLTLIGGLFIHGGLNFTNAYYDFKTGNDVINKTPTPFSGGVRFLREGTLRPRQVQVAGFICFAVGSAIGLYLNYICGGYTILAIGVTGVFIAYFYNADPLKIGYTRLSEVTTGFGFGTLMVLGAYYVQAKKLSWEAFFASIPIAILISLVQFINQFPDYEADKAARKNNTVVIVGKTKSAGYYKFFLISVYVIVLAGIAAGVFPFTAVITFVTLPAAVKAMKVASAHFDKIKELLPANALTIAIHLSFGILFTFAYLWGTK
ncbi:MAG: prenyltransferase [Candidatus Omnitrophota bacterium]|jgi:1,4-dihydroxy-2-naphthoate octaprenyltransferase